MKYELLVFDWDGTLMDSIARIVACVQAAATDLGYVTPSFNEARQIIGLGLNEAVGRLFRVTQPDEVERIAERYRYHFLGDEPTPETLFTGVEELLTGFDVAGYLLAVATGKSRRGLDRVLASTGLGGLFHATRCADECFSKPHPQMLKEIMAVLDVNPQNTLVIGDTEYDILMAQNAGADAVGVSYGAHSQERLLEHGAITCFDDIRQLEGWLTN